MRRTSSSCQARAAGDTAASAHGERRAARPSPQLLLAGRTVVAAARSADKASEVFTELGLQEGRQAEGKGDGVLFVQTGVDVTNGETLGAELFAGVTQVRRRVMPGDVVCCGCCCRRRRKRANDCG